MREFFKVTLPSGPVVKTHFVGDVENDTDQRTIQTQTVDWENELEESIRKEWNLTPDEKISVADLKK